MSPLPGWYPDPAAPDTQRYWDGEQWIGAALPADADPPPGPPLVAPPVPVVPAQAQAATPSGGGQGNPTAGGWGRPAGEAVTSRPPEPARGSEAAPEAPSRHAGPAGQLRRSGSTDLIPIDTARLAPLGRRVVARLIDIVAVFLLCAVVSGYFWYRFLQAITPVAADLMAGKTTLTISPEARRLNGIILVLTIGLWFAYEVPAIANTGQTLGKRIMGIRVIRALDDEVLSFGQSIRRWLILMLPSLATGAYGLPLQLIDLLWCTWDRPARQCLHDKAVASIVIRARAAPGTDQPRTPSTDVRRQ